MTKPPGQSNFQEKDSIERRIVSIRELGCWNDNTAAGYWDALHRCGIELKEALTCLHDVGNPALAEEHIIKSKSAMDEANRWFNRSNNSFLRIYALVAEVKALRSGQAVSYPKGKDPVSDEWEREPFKGEGNSHD